MAWQSASKQARPKPLGQKPTSSKPSGQKPSGGRAGGQKPVESKVPAGSRVWKGAKRAPVPREDVLKIRRTIIWYNKYGGLQTPLRINLLMGPLTKMGVKRAVGALHGLEEKGPEFENPTAWLLGSATKAGAVKPLDPETERKLRRTVTWYNNNMNLRQPINFRVIAGAMAELKPSMAMSLMKQLEAKAMEIEDPTMWLVAQAKWKAKEYIAKQLAWWYSEHGELLGPLHVDAVVPKLARLDKWEVKHVFKELETRKQEILNPTAWINGWAAKRSANRSKAKAAAAE